jgi:hypothetical protein
MAEAYLFYSSLTLLAMGCLTLVLSIFFRLKSRAMNSMPKNLSANVFNKTFIVFNPYSERTKIIHNLLSLLPILVFCACLGIVLVLFTILEYGFMLSFFVLIIGLNLMFLEHASEVYQNSETFIEAVQNGTKLGVGDLKVFQIVKSASPRISNYYLGLSVLFIALSAALPYIWSSALLFYALFVGSIFEVGLPTGIIAYQVAVFLFALIVVIFQILFRKIKGKLVSYLIEF